MSNEMTVFIVGAGLSHYAGLPLQSGFTKQLLDANNQNGKGRFTLPHLNRFVEQTFGFRSGQDIDLFPELEDIFTTLDLSANTGHHLGPDFPPVRLRSLRRVLLSRIIRMLNSAYLDGKSNPNSERESLLEFLRNVSHEKHQFVSLNWDVVLEACFEELYSPFSPFYSPEIHPVKVERNEVLRAKRSDWQMLIAKMHGSINWLYCDCCRRTFSIPVDRIRNLASQVLKNEEDRDMPATAEKKVPRLKCPSCSVDLSVRLATFSYQKALRAPMFESSWLEAEKALRRANKWVFIGYSLPAADFEFKYLLKRVELSRRVRPAIQVVTKQTKHSPATVDSPTVKSYKRFFGEQRLEFFRDGLTSESIPQIL